MENIFTIIHKKKNIVWFLPSISGLIFMKYYHCIIDIYPATSVQSVRDNWKSRDCSLIWDSIVRENLLSFLDRRQSLLICRYPWLAKAHTQEVIFFLLDCTLQILLQSGKLSFWYKYQFLRSKIKTKNNKKWTQQKVKNGKKLLYSNKQCQEKIS